MKVKKISPKKIAFGLDWIVDNNCDKVCHLQHLVK